MNNPTTLNTNNTSQFAVEEQYWLTKLSGDLSKCTLPYDFKKTEKRKVNFEKVNFDFTAEINANFMRLRNGSDARLHMILITGLVVFLKKYTDMDDIIIGTPIYKQDIEGEFINTALTLRNQLKENMTFKELLLEVRRTIAEADKHQNYPMEMLLQKLNMSVTDDEFSLFDIALLLENIQDKKYIEQTKPNLIFSFIRNDDRVEGFVEVNLSLYKKSTIERMIEHLTQIFTESFNNIDILLNKINPLTNEETNLLLIDFNNTDANYPIDQTVHELFEKQVTKTPDNIAVIAPTIDGVEEKLTYRELNEKANQLARFLKKKGVTTETVVGIMMERSLDMVISLLAIMKAGGAYLPIQPGLPKERVLYMLKDANAKILISDSQAMKEIQFTSLENFESNENIKIVVTESRGHIEAFDKLPMPDRSLITLKNYRNKIGMASVTNCISIQSTRGCPYKCLYCHKIWSKFHVHRSANNIYTEIEYYYKNGVRNFAFIDDCFNLDKENGIRLFKMIINDKLDIQIFFPNGLRGDILTPDYIDLMVEAGTRGINLSLETASPRLQKLLKKNLDLDNFKKVIDYITSQHPNVILEIATMHGFPTETEEEAMMTLDFIKEVKWLHFPYIHILKVFPNTEMEEFALANGVLKEDILISKDRAFHELPETLPFPKSFTRKYQSMFMNEYFLNKERLKHVLPVQMKILSEEALLQKYNAYLPVEIKNIGDLIDFAQLGDIELPEFTVKNNNDQISIFDREIVKREVKPQSKKILLLDLSQHFSSKSMLYKVTEQPLGLIYLMTYLKEKFGDQIDGWVYKSGNDFDSYAELKALIDKYQPDMIGIRTLTFFKEFFHETVSLLRQWGVEVPIITGGPYASSDYDTILKDKNVDVVTFGEGEYTLAELVEEMLKNDFKLPKADILKNIKGIAYAEYPVTLENKDQSNEIILLDQMKECIAREETADLELNISGNNLAYVMYTSGSTGKPKGVMVEHRQINNCIYWMQDKFNLIEEDVIVQRTNLTFDPSVWELFWPLYIGGSVKLLSTYQGKDAEYLMNLMAEDNGLTMMYCPATMVSAMTYLLNKMTDKPKLKLPWLLIGAEPISMEVVKNFYKYYNDKIVNTYGPTECTINNTYYDLERDDSRAIVPIGEPVHNNKIYILSNDSQLKPINVPGEICIAGQSVARGYINNSEKTEASFIENPFGEGKLYKTGDIGRWLDDGNIEIMGRVDEQVKIRGYRIELGEIETAILRNPAVNDCVVVVKDSSEANKDIKVCKKCGVTTKYPGVTINEEGLCDVCLDYDEYKTYIDQYFGTFTDLEEKIRTETTAKESKYDCLLIYSGGRGSAYALYNLVEKGFNVLALTYDNGYFTKSDLENIKNITAKLGVDHVLLTHKNSDQILKESMDVANTVCRGCYHTSSSLAGEYAYNHNIKVVIGATLSRGQIIDNKLFMWLKQGIKDIDEIENKIFDFAKNAPEMDKKIFEHIDIDLVSNKSVHDKVKFIDFYRYIDISNEEIISYLDEKDEYWKSRKRFAIYSTNCPIKQIGDFGHLKNTRYHYYGSATSWEKRLRHITLENLKEDLNCNGTKKGYENFINKIGFEEDQTLEKKDKYLVAYMVSDQEIVEADLRDFLVKEIPEYMVPGFFMQLDEIPLTANGKVDKKVLPLPERSRRRSGATYVAPENDMEIKIAEIWKEMLGIDQVGVNDSFFDLGGNSLDVIQVSSKMKEDFEKDISVVTIFTYPTVRKLSEFLKAENEIKEIDRTEKLNQGKNRLKQRRQKLRK
ncbi:MAG: AMP-binding protein [Halanaerobiales bacterium]|nr:AMP-binding protein [Halanaerobiales bacterium]